MPTYYNAIFFDNKTKAYKYRNIKDIERFESYIRGKYEVLYVNYYDKKTKKYLFRNYLKRI